MAHRPLGGFPQISRSRNDAAIFTNLAEPDKTHGFGFPACDNVTAKEQRMRVYTFALLALAALSTGGFARGQTAPTTVDGYVSAAKSAAGTDWAGTFLRICIPPGPPTAAPAGNRGTPARETWYAEPAKVADNLYFIGTKIHSAWALVGSQGIIVIEALFDYAAKDEIVDGLKKLGLDAGKVKYVILSHAHGDHDGGAKLLQDTFTGAHLVYGAEDWATVDKSTNHMGGKPRHDVTGDDGMTISVGDVSLKIVTMPGHTPGTLSYLFEVRDHGKSLRVAYVGGTAIPFNADAKFYDGYLASSRKMAKASSDFGATALITNHTEFDDAWPKAHAAADRKDGGPNPFDVGAGGVARYFTVVRDCTEAVKLRAAAK
jgi:metallo-beta-lactamase class B